MSTWKPHAMFTSMYYFAGSHCLDLHFGNTTDPDWLVLQRKTEIKIMEGWIETYYTDMVGTKGGLDSASTQSAPAWTYYLMGFAQIFIYMSFI